MSSSDQRGPGSGGETADPWAGSDAADQGPPSERPAPIEPLIPWSAPNPVAPEPGRGSTGELFGGMPASLLSFTTALETGFKILLRHAFIGPILVISILINALVELTITPLLLGITGVPDRFTAEDLTRLLTAGLVTFGITLVGGLLVSVYGQIWAAAASSGPAPSLGTALSLSARRGLAFLGTAIVLTLLSLLVLAPTVLVLAVLFNVDGALGFLALFPVIGLYLWFASRLSMASWLAADGLSVASSISGSWRITQGSVLMILGWSIGYGLLFGLITAALGAVLQNVPLVGGGIAQAIGLGLGYGAGVTLYRRTQAAGALPATLASGT